MEKQNENNAFVERNNVQRALNHNSMMFNFSIASEVKIPSNLIKRDFALLTKNRAEKDLSKERKLTYKKNPNSGRQDMINQIIEANVPNWGSLRINGHAIRL